MLKDTGNDLTSVVRLVNLRLVITSATNDNSDSESLGGGGIIFVMAC